jgi:UDP-N-acetylglucosamine 2-epimerase (non-hydrolysing)
MKIVLVAGARPNFMKVAPIIRALGQDAARSAGLTFELVHTGQHYDERLSRVFFDELQLPRPHANLMAGSGSQAEQTGRIMVEFEKYLAQHPADLVVVVGDVNSTLACAIVAKKLVTPVAHVEAGIRSFDMSMPEEINRMVTDSISDYFFTTSEVASQNLLAKGADPDRIFFVGNTMIDTLLDALPRARKPAVWQEAALREQHYLVLTLHRPSNVDDAKILADWLQAVNDLGWPVVFPAHPRTYKTIIESGSVYPNIFICEPLGYLEFIYLLQFAKAVVTDSGGVQEETTVLRVPCVTLRTTTERPETVTMGTNILVGTNHSRFTEVMQSLNSSQNTAIPPLWDGRAAERIVEALIRIAKNPR